MLIASKYFQFSQKTLIPSHSFLLKDAEAKNNEAQHFIHISQSQFLNLLLEVHKLKLSSKMSQLVTQVV